MPVGNPVQQPTPLPEDENITLQDLVSKEDPRECFDEIVKIGEGAAGEVDHVLSVSFFCFADCCTGVQCSGRARR